MGNPLATKTGTVKYIKKPIEAELLYRWDNDQPETPVGLNPAGWSVSSTYDVVEGAKAGQFVADGYWMRTPDNLEHSRSYYEDFRFRTDSNNQCVYVAVEVSSENNFDKGYVLKPDSTDESLAVWTGSGEQKNVVRICIPIAGEHFIRTVYSKDSGVSRGLDRMRARLIRPSRLWMVSGCKGTWSTPSELKIDTDQEESIYLKSSIENLNAFFQLPESDEFVDDSIGDAPAFKEGNTYHPGNMVSWNSKTYLCLKETLKDPTKEPKSWMAHRWWTDDPSGVSDSEPYEYVSVRCKVGGRWRPYAPYTLFTSKGKKGEQGPPLIPYPAGYFEAGIVYRQTDYTTPFVMMKDDPQKYKYVLISPTSQGSGTPQEDVASRGGHWALLEQYKFLESEIALIHLGLIGASVFWDNFTFSKHGYNSDGQLTSENAYKSFDPTKLGQYDCPFTPNLYIDWLKGMLVAENAKINGEIRTQKGIIGNYKIDPGGMRSDYDLGEGEGYKGSMSLTSRYISFEETNTSGNISVMFGARAVSSLIPFSECPIRIESVNTKSFNPFPVIGMYVTAKGCATVDDEAFYGNHALYIPKGDICGFRRRTRRVANDSTTIKNFNVDLMDSNLIVKTEDKKNVALNLPSDAEDGQEYTFVHTGTGGWMYMRSRSGHTIKHKGDASVTEYISKVMEICRLVFDGNNKVWFLSIM